MGGDTWRPLEVFLYDWWPILGEIRLFDRLSQMPVHIEYNEAVSSGVALRTGRLSPPPRAGAVIRREVESGSIGTIAPATRQHSNQAMLVERRDGSQEGTRLP